MFSLKGLSILFLAASANLLPSIALGDGYAKYSTRLKTYVSEWTHDYTYYQNNQAYITAIDINSADFFCPGGSFLIGMASKWSNNLRRYRFACAFLEDAKGQLLSKTFKNCTNNTAWSKLVTGQSTCAANQFIGGIKTALDNTGTKPDQSYYAKCCAVDSASQAKVTSDSCSAPKSFTTSADSPMILCPADTVIQAITTNFQPVGTSSDRTITATCCKLKTSP